MPLLTTIDAQLKSAANFAVLGSSTVTNSGATVISGANLGLYPGTSVTGFPPGIVVPPATEQITTQVANQAEIDWRRVLPLTAHRAALFITQPEAQGYRAYQCILGGGQKHHQYQSGHYHRPHRCAYPSGRL